MQGCIEITERIDVNEDRSGSISLSVSISEGNLLLGLIKFGGEVDVLDDVEDVAEGYAGLLSVSDGIHNVKVMRDKKNESVRLSFDFDNQRQLNRALYAAAGLQKTLFKPAVYKVKAKSFRKMNMTPLLEMLLEEEGQEILPSFINYTYEINLPRSAKSVSVKNATLLHDGHTVKYRGNVADILEKKSKTGIKIKF